MWMTIYVKRAGISFCPCVKSGSIMYFCWILKAENKVVRLWKWIACWHDTFIWVCPGNFFVKKYQTKNIRNQQTLHRVWTKAITAVERYPARTSRSCSNCISVCVPSTWTTPPNTHTDTNTHSQHITYEMTSWVATAYLSLRTGSIDWRSCFPCGRKASETSYRRLLSACFG